MLGAFAAMMFVGASWGANLPVTKVMLSHFDLMPMAALRTVAATAALALLLGLVEGRAALRIDLGLVPLPLVRPDDGELLCLLCAGHLLQQSDHGGAVQVAGPLVSAATVWLVTGQRFDRGFGVALALTVRAG